MTSRPALIVLVLALLVVGGGGAAWALFLRGDNVAPLALPGIGSRASAGAGAAAGSAGASSETLLPVTSGAPIDAASLPGAWTIGADSIVGYRVRERLASLPADSDAVGRTNAITGSATLGAGAGGLLLTEADFSVDMTTLASDRQMRDNRLRRDGIETDQFPTATFSLTKPVGLPVDAASGGRFSVTLHGDLTLHGVPKTIDIAATAQLNGGVIQVLGSLTFPFSDYGINAPNIAGFVSVEDSGTLEFQVNLTKG
ncbi:MAG: YceI family protein [Candidatus Limnocylindrales bacterium]